MGEKTGISWTDSTFNPWWGCTKVSPGCANCYAETLAVTRRKLPVWGPAPRFGRKFMSEGHWKGPEKWNRAAAAAGVRHRVFCASMADVFDEHPDVVPHRARLFDLIERTPHLDWQLLTKRPERVMEAVPPDWHGGFPRNVWIGTSVEDQERADERIPLLLEIPAAVRFLSCEPLLGPVNLGLTRFIRDLDRMPWDDGPAGLRYLTERGRGLHWVIVGGESGPGARPCNVKWIRDLVAQASRASVPVFVKQLGAVVLDRNDAGFGDDDLPGSWPDEADVTEWGPWYQGSTARVHLGDRKGGDPSEWPEDLRIREFPHG